MSGIFAYTGNSSAKEILISGISKLYNSNDKTSGIILKEEGGFTEIKVNAPPSELETKPLESDSKTGIAKCAKNGRCVFSALTSPPAANSLFAAAIDGEIYNFSALKRIYQNQFPILSEDDLLLACLSAFSEEDKMQLSRKISELFFANPSFAFISSDDNAIYCRSGIMKLIIGVSASGVFLSGELGALVPFCEKYTVLESGECARLSRDKISVFDSKQRRVKKVFTPICCPNVRESSVLSCDEVHFAPLAIKETYRKFVCNQQLSFDYLKLKSSYFSKVNKIILIGSPSSKNAVKCAKSIFESYCSMGVCFFDSSEFLCSVTPIDRNTLVIAASKSGEDKATLLGIRKAKESKAKTIALTCNSLSALSRESDMLISPLPYYERRCLPLTDFISDYFSLCLFSLYFGYETDVISELYLGVSLKMAELLTGILSAALKSSVKHENAARLINDADCVYFCSPGTDNSLSFAAAEILRNETEKNAFAVAPCELEKYPAPLLNNSLVIALITDKEGYIEMLESVIRIKVCGINTIILTGEGIRLDADEFENIITYSDSLPSFNPIPCIASVYSIAKEVEKQGFIAER